MPSLLVMLVTDCIAPILTWDVKVSTAMRRDCTGKQDRHLSTRKEGAPLGPVYPRLPRKRHASAPRGTTAARRRNSFRSTGRRGGARAGQRGKGTTRPTKRAREGGVAAAPLPGQQRQQLLLQRRT